MKLNCPKFVSSGVSDISLSPLKAGIPMKQAEGTLSSLLQKGIVEVEMAYEDMNVFDKGEFLYTFTEKFCRWVVAGGDYTTKN